MIVVVNIAAVCHDSTIISFVSLYNYYAVTVNSVSERTEKFNTRHD